MQWIEVTVNTAPDRLEDVCSRLEAAGVEGLVIEDEGEYNRFLEENRQYWDYVDEAFADSIRGLCRVKFYTSEDEDGAMLRAATRAAVPGEDILETPVRDEDWENNWKAYYKPIPVGERLLIVPQWEEIPESTDRVVLRLDPGLIFGTGNHATTQMCLEAVQTLPVEGASVLDLGCGSGILAIAALLLGAKDAVGVDVDPKAPDVVLENAALNSAADRLTALAGDCVADSGLRARLSERSYDVIFANIVADVILRLAPAVRPLLAPGGVFIASGIIGGREDEVAAALKSAGLTVSEHRTRENWHCFVCR